MAAFLDSFQVNPKYWFWLFLLKCSYIRMEIIHRFAILSSRCWESPRRCKAQLWLWGSWLFASGSRESGAWSVTTWAGGSCPALLLRPIALMSRLAWQQCCHLCPTEAAMPYWQHALPTIMPGGLAGLSTHPPTSALSRSFLLVAAARFDWCLSRYRLRSGWMVTSS